MDYISQFQKEITVILLGAGNSTRFLQKGLPKKQWLRIGKVPLWKHVADCFMQFGFENILVTSSCDEVFYAKNFFSHVIEGGDSRTQSILRALKHVETEYVLIHDVARFYPIQDVIKRLLEAGLNCRESACIAPRLEIADTLQNQDGSYPKREDFFAIQTPQLSKRKILKEALCRGEFSDESSAVKACGERVAYVQGSSLLHKLTNPSDLFFARSLLQEPSTEVFVGGGVDIHGFEEGKKMVLCGVEIPSSVGFKAHSDGDVGIHSVIDALLGAMGAGDIGEWFPDTDECYLNMDSKILLKRVKNFVQNMGYEIVNLDLTVLAQIPKLSPHKLEMKESLAKLLDVSPAQINIKATTSEGFGFIGRKEGVCVFTQASLRFIQWSIK